MWVSPEAEGDVELDGEMLHYVSESYRSDIRPNGTVVDGRLAATAVITSNGWRRLEGCGGTRGKAGGAALTGARWRRNKVLSAARTLIID